MKQYKINLLWDDDARVWVATSEDVSGLVLESGSLDALIERVKIAIPELLELNKYSERNEANLLFSLLRVERVAL